MRLTRRFAMLAVAVTTAIGGLALIAPAANAAPAPAASAHRAARACSAAGAGMASCHAWVRTDITPAATPAGYGPADLRSAYKLTTAGSSSQTIAIVDAFDDPNAESDLAVYRSQFGLPACTTANGCFRKVDQNGGTNYPRRNTGWAEEISLDVDMVSAICPNCHILLVEATSNSLNNLGTAVNRAAALGANAISNSYGGSDASDASLGSFYNHPGIAVTASSGDSGFGAQYPATSHYVTAVGGTHLTAGGGTRGWTETVWSGAGSGCSAFNTALTGAAGFNTGCARRAEADVSAVADPNTGVAVYDSYGSTGGANWYVFGGTSVAAPIIASVYGLAGNAGATDYPARLAYASPGSLFDVTSGSNGNCSKGKRNISNRYLCTAGPGYDGPTGLGTPNGLGGF
jgi:subtilase family serine protease